MVTGRDLPVPGRIAGMDFSGAARAGSHIWICQAVPEGDAVRVTALFQARDLPGSGVDRAACLPALRRWVATLADTAIGMDFPFSLPETMLDHRGWSEWATDLGRRFADADAFRADCRRRSGRPELKRRSDRESQAPFSPYNLWIYRQTYHGVRDLLSPLVREGTGCVLPMQRRLERTPWMLETCPASLLKRLSLYIPYKGRGARERANRATILERVVADASLRFADPDMPARMLADTHGDALDSLLTVAIVAGHLRDPVHLHRLPRPPYDREGVVFF